MSQSQINDVLLYIPAALQGILYIVHMREIESAFIDSSVAAEHNLLLPPCSTDYVGLSGPGPYTQTPVSNPDANQSRISKSDDEAFTKQPAKNPLISVEETAS